MVKIVANVEGMACSMCEAHMTDAVKQNFDAKKISSSHQKKEVSFLCADSVSEEKLRAVVEKAGYKLISFKSEPYAKKGFSIFGRK